MLVKINFIYSAISDTQSTIRAIDVKVAALLTGVLIPLSSVGKIWAHFINVNSKLGFEWSFLIGGFFLLLWGMAALSLVFTLSAIDNPSKHLIGYSKCKGGFYGGGVFDFGLADVFLNRSIVKARHTVEKFSERYPLNESDVVAELTLEHMKLIYIRDAKLNRFNWAVKISILWVALGVGIYVFSKLC